MDLNTAVISIFGTILTGLILYVFGTLRKSIENLDSRLNHKIDSLDSRLSGEIKSLGEKVSNLSERIARVEGELSYISRLIHINDPVSLSIDK